MSGISHALNVQAEYINAAALFVSKEPTRLTLACIYVIPSKNGAIIFSTDGHIAFIAFDPHGEASRTIGIQPHKDVIKACGKGIDQLGTNRLILDADFESLQIEVTNEETSEVFIQSFTPPPIDLVLFPPNFSELINSCSRASKGFHSLSLNANYLALLPKMFKEKGFCCPLFHQADDNSSAYITFAKNKDVLLLLMPVGTDDAQALHGEFIEICMQAKSLSIWQKTEEEPAP